MDKDKEEQSTFRVTDRRGQPKEEVRSQAPEAQVPPPPRQKRPTEPSPREEAHPGHETGPIDFSTFILSLSTSALLHMGYSEDPQEAAEHKNLAMARQEIDMIAMLREKTKGNLNPKENQLMEGVLYELQMRFVEASRKR